MEQQCAGSGRELPEGPPPAAATACPECGRGTAVDGHEVDGTMKFTIADHQRVAKSTP